MDSSSRCYIEFDTVLCIKILNTRSNDKSKKFRRSSRTKRLDYTEPPDKPEDDSVIIQKPMQSSIGKTIQTLLKSYNETDQRIKQYDTLRQWEKPNANDDFDTNVLEKALDVNVKSGELDEMIKVCRCYFCTFHFSNANQRYIHCFCIGYQGN